MAMVIVITRTDKPELKNRISVDRKIVIGNSIYCDVVLDDKSVASMQCQIYPVKTGHIIVKNLDLKKEVLINKMRLKKSAIRADDILKIGPYILQIDSNQLTEDELRILNTEYEEFV